MTFPEESVADEINANTVPVQLNVLKERDKTKEHRVPWTPTFLFLDSEGVEQHRFIGYLPPDEFKAQLHMAKAKDAFGKGKWQEAYDAYNHIVENFTETDLAPESLYWTGVCEFKLTKDVEKIHAKCREVVERFPGHIWAKKLDFSTDE